MTCSHGPCNYRDGACTICGDPEPVAQVFNIWADGYTATGTEGMKTEPVLLGKQVGQDFKDACRRLAERDKDFKDYFDAEQMTYWGCRLAPSREEVVGLPSKEITLSIGIAAPQGATVNVVQHRADGTHLVVYQGTAQPGDSIATFKVKP